MKKIIIIVLIFAVLAAAGIIGYQTLNGKFFSPKVLTSDDNKFSMEVPSSWEVTDTPNASSLFAAQNSDASIYVTMSVKSMTAGYTVDDYLNEYIAQVAANSDDPAQQMTVVEPQERTFGDNKGYYFELSSTADGITVHLRDFVMITMDGCVHVDVVADPEKGEEAAAAAKEIFASVRYSSDGNVSASE